MTEIREMSVQDCEAVWKLQKQCFSVPWSLDSIRAMPETEGYVNLVAVQDGQIVGYIGIKAVLDEADITNVAVTPACRGQGLGGRLLGALLSEAENRGIRHIFQEVRVSNAAARTLYARAGFRDISLRKNYYEKPREDACIMEWTACQ